jgi:hypothetical protein
MARVIKKSVKTRYCACPDDLPRDCRFTSNSQCPSFHLPTGRWLWADQFVDIDTGEIVDPTQADEVVQVEPESSVLAPAPLNTT